MTKLNNSLPPYAEEIIINELNNPLEQSELNQNSNMAEEKESKDGRGNLLSFIGIELLIDIADLDQIIADYDYSRWGDQEYHNQLFGGNERFKNLYTAFDNLANRVLARNIIVTNRLTHGEDKESEENIMKHAFDYQQCYKIPEPKIYSEMRIIEAEKKLQAVVDQALTGDKELLSRIADLPYIKTEQIQEALGKLQQPIPNNFSKLEQINQLTDIQQITNLQDRILADIQAQKQETEKGYNDNKEEVEKLKKDKATENPQEYGQEAKKRIAEKLKDNGIKEDELDEENKKD
ncbi:17299_t:CDS:2 [Entrophospora sp. SA101]|nr:17299_t:CDS:2 [Entrophospora sp. SA101]